MLRTACLEAAGWAGDVSVAVNLSALQFKNGAQLIETVLEALHDSGLPKNRLELEVTEGLLIEDKVEAQALIKTFRRHDIGVSLDDFGCGFSSLGYLHEFPFSKLKLDRSSRRT